MAMANLLNERVKEIRRIARAHGVVRLRVFGSHASGTATASSDLDLLVDLKPRRDLLDLIGFKLDLEDLLGCRVDVVTEGSLSPYLRARILREARAL
jgi:predicted nucleotidyltransferase